VIGQPWRQSVRDQDGADQVGFKLRDPQIPDSRQREGDERPT
jgi:hypothetical protein